MGFNMFKEIPKIKANLWDRGYKKNIPVDELVKTIMVEYGMKRETVAKWLKYFKENKIIVVNGSKVNFL